MIELKGKFNTCKIYTDNVDPETISQLMALLNQESVQGNQIRIMPDTHAGKGCQDQKPRIRSRWMHINPLWREYSEASHD